MPSVVSFVRCLFPLLNEKIITKSKANVKKILPVVENSVDLRGMRKYYSPRWQKEE